ncbi:hypothetical protein BLA60_29185 [Actinophytocola xinjiangensis]|uniref:Uncharacterized protein n=1 Tax=Actinophytocola xinjiangensis TaxID=485602 RepID=A0A7Z0WGY5_9PSEU|nr:hypothetical protein [Actinophytocola xinjiangensis]OLF06940.1 hypothetical protein BLA60_29185 [Actinophytocola xinjiangensis]
MARRSTSAAGSPRPTGRATRSSTSPGWPPGCGWRWAVPRPPIVGVRAGATSLLVRRETEDDLLRRDLAPGY